MFKFSPLPRMEVFQYLNFPKIYLCHVLQRGLLAACEELKLIQCPEASVEGLTVITTRI